MDDDALGREVRAVRTEWARQQPDCKPSWVVPYDELDERDREADRRTGRRLFNLGAQYAHGQLTAGLVIDGGTVTYDPAARDPRMDALGQPPSHEDFG